MTSSVSGETDRTIEFELTADDVVRGLDSLHTNQPSFAERSLDGARAPRLRSPGIVLAIGVALAVLSKPAGPARGLTTVLAHETVASETLSTPSTRPVPLRLANPFDATEIFEFPAGTSLEYARESVAEFLLDRARGRHVRHERRPRNRREQRNS